MSASFAVLCNASLRPQKRIVGLCWQCDGALRCVQIPAGLGAAVEGCKDKETAVMGMAGPCRVTGAQAAESCLQSSQMAACSH
jgi:hypothetical protein